VDGEIDWSFGDGDWGDGTDYDGDVDSEIDWSFGDGDWRMEPIRTAMWTAR